MTSLILTTTVHPHLVEAARDALGLRDETPSVLLRAALAAAAGLDPAQHATVRRGRPPTRSRCTDVLPR
jgi:hypothetical protein